MAMGLGQGVELQQPMAITTIGGLLAATFLSLIFLPSVYYIGAGFFERFKRSPAEEPEPLLGMGHAGSPVAPPDRVEEPPPPEASPPEEWLKEEEPPPEVRRALEEEEEEEEKTKEVALPPQPAVPPEPPAPPEVPEIPEGYGGEEAVPDRPESGLLPSLPSVDPPESPEPEKRDKQERQVEPPGPQAPPPFNPRQEKLLEYLKTHPRITRKEYVELTGASVPTAARDLKELVDRGLIRGFGPLARGRYYVLA